MALLQPGPRAGGYFGSDEHFAPLIRGGAAHTGHMSITTPLGSCCRRNRNALAPPHLLWKEIAGIKKQTNKKLGTLVALEWEGQTRAQKRTGVISLKG